MSPAHPPARPPALPATLESNLRDVLDEVERVSSESGRSSESVRLLPVTKSVGAEMALALAALGRSQLAENRLESLIAKRARFAEAGVEVEWHFIGHIQRNKARKVLQNASVLHSVDSLRLLQTLERIAAEEGLHPEIYLEVKTSTEAEKHGLEADELEECVRLAGSSQNLRLRGLMTMASRPREGEDQDASAEPCFRELARLAQELTADLALRTCFEDQHVDLSMGMSGDYRAAIRAGSHLCRVGSALYRGLDNTLETT